MSADDQNEAAQRADAEAVQWVLLLREEPDDPEVCARFDAWLADSPRNARAWADTAHAYDRSGDVHPVFVQAGAADGRRERGEVPVRHARARRQPSTHPARRRVGRRLTLVAMAAAACLTIAAAPGVMLHIEADHVTGTAEVREIPLPDGSVAQLAPGSAIAVAMANGQRQIRLLRGEAWFDVRHDPSRPFQVDANGVTTTVLGTAFDVKVDAESATTEVERGRVRIEHRIHAANVSEELAPGDSVRVAFAGGSRRDLRPVVQVAAWRHRQIIVHDRPAAEVIDALRPWFRGVIIVRGDAFSRQRVTGVYNAADPLDALHGLLQAHGGRVIRMTPWVIVLTEN